MTAVKVGHVESDDGNYWFCREMDHVRLDNIQDPESAMDILDFYLKNRQTYAFEVQATEVVVGKAVFHKLTTGLYLIIQDKAADGYTRLTPFLVSVPYMEDGDYQYHVTVNVKSELEREPENTVTEPSKPPRLPQTGQLNWPVPVLAALGMTFLATGFWIRCSRKKEKYEK